MNGHTAVVTRHSWSAFRAVDRRSILAALTAAAAAWTILAEGLSLDVYRRIDAANVLGLAVHDALPTVVAMVAGVVAIAVRPSSRTGAWMFLAGMLWFVGNLGNTQVPGVQQLGAGFTDMYLVAMAVVILTYPTGYFVRPAHRRLAIVATAWMLVLGALITASLDPATCPPGLCPANPFLVIRGRDLGATIYDVGQVVGAVLWLAFAACVLERWMHATPLARRLLVPVWIVGILVVAGNLVSMLLSATGPADLSQAWDFWVNTAIQASVPIVLLAGLLRSRLARASIGEFVEEVSRGVSLGSLRDSFARLVGDPGLQLAFPLGEGTFADADGQALLLPPMNADRVITPIERGGREVAVVIHDAALETDPALVRAAGAAAGLALENEQLAAEVRARLEAVRSSRARLVEAADAERVRIERMLHDGAQQRLVALAIELRTLAADTADDHERARLDALGADLDEALAELRELARGIHPAVLVQAGLRSALESLAQRSPVPVTVECPDRRFAETIEATAYYVAAEGLTNAVRHANASEVTISVAVSDALVLVVRDDGVGAAAPTGSGLVGLDDRVAAVGGRLEVRSPPGRGTELRATLPLHGIDG